MNVNLNQKRKRKRKRKDIKNKIYIINKWILNMT